MKRIDRRDIADAIFVAIKCAPKLLIDRLRGNLPAENDKAVHELTEAIVRQVDGDRRGVFEWGPSPANLFPQLDACPSLKDKRGKQVATGDERATTNPAPAAKDVKREGC